ncbi:lysozyme inhibitor LprI family protein [Inhella proteolytica]
MSTRSLARIFLALFSFYFAKSAVAQEFTACALHDLSHLEASKCLGKEYRELDKLLKQKVTFLVESATPVDMSGRPPEQVQAARQRIQDAIRQADVSWRRNLQFECDTLIEASYGLGNGWDIDSFECRITKTRDRIKFLSTSTSYAWITRK